MIRIENYAFINFFAKYTYVPRRLQSDFDSVTAQPIDQSMLGLLLKRGLKLLIIKILTSFRLNLSRVPVSPNFYNPLPSLGALTTSTSLTRYLQFESIQIYNRLYWLISDFKPLFMLFFSKTNKLIYKYSRYKVPKYVLQVYYLPVYKRFRRILSFTLKSINYTSDLSVTGAVSQLFLSIVSKGSTLKTLNYLQNLQHFVLHNYKKELLIQTGKPQKYLSLKSKSLTA